MPTIYSISHPSQPFVIYIGKTQASLRERISNHINSNNGSNINMWLKELMAGCNKKPRIEMVDVCDSSVACETERFWIEQFRCWGFRLLNKNGNTRNSRPKHKINPVGRPRAGRKYRSKKPKKAINQYDLRGNLIAVHYGTSAASVASGLDFSTIWRQLKGDRKNPRKYIFKYAA